MKEKTTEMPMSDEKRFRLILERVDKYIETMKVPQQDPVSQEKVLWDSIVMSRTNMSHLDGIELANNVIKARREIFNI